jgi:TM2 domain-containing membrane protein YozV
VPGWGQPLAPPWNQPPADLPPGADWGFKDRKLPAGICGIFFGSLGVHKFILGLVKQGVIMVAVTVGSWLVFVLSFAVPFLAIGTQSSDEEASAAWFIVMLALWAVAGLAMTAVWVVGLVEGIMYFTKSDRDFVVRYGVERRGWF